MTWWRMAMAPSWMFVVATVAAACARHDTRPTGDVQPQPPIRPESCRDVPPGALHAAVDTAPDNAPLCLLPGIHAGPIRIDRRLTLWGPRTAVIRSAGIGTTIDVTANVVQLLGFTVDGSGNRFDQQDAAVRIEGNDVRIEGLRIEHALFGIWTERSTRITVRANEIHGKEEPTLGLRGDGIRLWETYDSVVERNIVRDSRDVVVWYSSRNDIIGNTIERSRYGTHFMYSRDVVARDNRYVDNVVGIFVMYGQNVFVEDNLIAGSAGAAGMGLGLKEAGNVVALRNVFVQNTTGIYLDTSPLNRDDHNLFAQNAFYFSTAAVIFHGSQVGNAFFENDFGNNRTQVAVEGGSDALGTRWSKNHWSDYAGYDLDGDGIGDIPYELRSLSGDLMRRAPAVEFFRGTPALDLADAVSRIIPLFAPRRILVDRAPRMIASGKQVAHAR